MATSEPPTPAAEAKSTVEGRARELCDRIIENGFVVATDVVAVLTDASRAERERALCDAQRAVDYLAGASSAIASLKASR